MEPTYAIVTATARNAQGERTATYVAYTSKAPMVWLDGHKAQIRKSSSPLGRHYAGRSDVQVSVSMQDIPRGDLAKRLAVVESYFARRYPNDFLPRHGTAEKWEAAIASLDDRRAAKGDRSVTAPTHPNRVELLERELAQVRTAFNESMAEMTAAFQALADRVKALETGATTTARPRPPWEA